MSTSSLPPPVLPCRFCPPPPPLHLGSERIKLQILWKKLQSVFHATYGPLFSKSVPELSVEPGGGRAVHEVGPPPAADAEALAGVELGAVARVRNQVVGGVLRNLGADTVVR